MSRRTGPGLRRGALLGLLLGAAVSSAGCAALLGGLRTAPSGLSESDQELRSLLADGRSERALTQLDGRDVGDELLQLQYRGLAAHYAGRWEESSRALERAFEVAEDRYTKSVTRALLSLVTSDRMLDYDPPRPERLFLHYYGALNYLQRAEPDEAAVEARRLGYVLQGALEEEDASVPAELGQSLSVFAGAVFEAAGQGNDADVAYRRARAFGERAAGADGGDTDAGEVPGGTASRPALPGWPDVDPDADGASRGREGRVLVVLERGFVAHKVERALTLFLTPGELRRVHRFRQSARAGNAPADTSGILELAERVADRSLDAGSSRRSVRRGPRFRDVDPVLFRIAWPELREPARRPAPASLRVAGPAPAGASAAGAASPGSVGQPAGTAPGTDRTVRVQGREPRYRADLSRAIRAAFDGSRAQIMAKSLVRAVAKMSLAEGIEEAASEEDETLGDVLGVAAQVAGALLERADTRSWHLLPDRLEVYLLRLPPGQHVLEARARRPGGGERRIRVGPVDVEPGGVHVVTARDWNGADPSGVTTEVHE